jgi:ABC-type polysaccharide/polyol phosphate transport system ATPase subunit
VTATIEAQGLGIRFQFDRERRVVTPTLAKLRRRGSETWGLHQIDLRVGPGEGIALIGRSGSGKTTLLRTLAAILVPDEGSLVIEGRVGSLLSIDAGLMSVLTGRENAVLRAVLAGIPRAEARARLDQIRDRTGLGAYFERPVSSFSQGMRARLGFAVAEQAEPDILLLDEVHEALDHEFREVVERRAQAIVAAGGIVVAAGHDHPMLSRLCDRAIWMEGGKVREDDAFDEVQPRYVQLVEAGDG